MALVVSVQLALVVVVLNKTQLTVSVLSRRSTAATGYVCQSESQSSVSKIGYIYAVYCLFSCSYLCYNRRKPNYCNFIHARKFQFSQNADSDRLLSKKFYASNN